MVNQSQKDSPHEIALGFSHLFLDYKHVILTNHTVAEQTACTHVLPCAGRNTNVSIEFWKEECDQSQHHGIGIKECFISIKWIHRGESRIVAGR